MNMTHTIFAYRSRLSDEQLCALDRLIVNRRALKIYVWLTLQSVSILFEDGPSSFTWKAGRWESDVGLDAHVNRAGWFLFDSDVE